jgi:RNA polymerase sigma factor (sigma-70 family)
MTSTTRVRREHHTGELDLFRVYLDQIGRHPLLTQQDEIELSRAYQEGLDARLALAELPAGDRRRPALASQVERGEWARRKMIESNLRLVVSIAGRFSATGLPLGDLVQEGNLGLLRAVERFDWRRGCKFSTYATWWIRQAIARGARRRPRRPRIRLPVHIDEEVGRLRREADPRIHFGRGSQGVGARWPPARLSPGGRERPEPTATLGMRASVTRPSRWRRRDQ